MRLSELYSRGIYSADPLALVELQEEQLKEKKEALQASPASPASWGDDRVSISLEARNAAQEAAAAEAAKDEEEPTAREEYAAYMKDSRSRAQGFDPEKQIQDLQDKLKGLQGQLVQLTSDDTPESGKQAKIDSLNSQINSLMERIAELGALAAQVEEQSA